MADTLPFMRGMMFCPPSSLTGMTKTIDASNDSIAIIYSEPRGSVAITKINWPCGDVTLSPTAEVRVETVSAAQPTGTLATANANLDAPPTANSWNSYTLTSSHTPSQNDEIAIVLQGGASADASNFFVTSLGPAATIATQHPLFLEETTGSWAELNRWPSLEVEYSDGLIIPFSICPVTAATQHSFDSADTPDEWGNHWTPAVAMDVTGAVFYMQANADTSDFDVVLSSGGTQQRVARVTGDHMRFGSNQGVGYVTWAPYTAAAGAAMRVTIRPVSATDVVVVRSFDFEDSTSRSKFMGELQRTSQTDGGGYSETATEVLPIYPIISDITAAGSGGLLLHPGMSGGING